MNKENIIASSVIAGLIAGGCSQVTEMDLSNCNSYDGPENYTHYLQESALGTLFELKVGEHIYVWDPGKYNPYHLYQKEPNEKAITPPNEEKFFDALTGRDVTITFTSKNWDVYAFADISSECR